MIKIIVLAFSICLSGTGTIAQLKVAGYSLGKAGTDKYERLEFWTKDGKRSEINYVYGKNRKEVKLQYLGKDLINGNACFKVRYPNKYVLYIILKTPGIQVIDSDGKYNKTFLWEYEGPLNGIGTYCNVCAEDDEDALEMLESAYLK